RNHVGPPRVRRLRRQDRASSGPGCFKPVLKLQRRGRADSLPAMESAASFSQSGSQEGSEAQAYAALDLGTNNCRLLIAAPEGPGFRVIESFSRIVRLGEGLTATGRLAPRAMGRAIEALRICAGRLSRYRGLRLRAVATE